MKHRLLQPTHRNPQPNQKGQAMLIVTMFLLAISTSVMLGVSTPVLRQNSISDNFTDSKQSYATSESGVEDVLYRLKKGMAVSLTEILKIGGSTATTTITDTGSNEKRVIAEGNFDNRVRKTETNVTVASGASFNYGVQVGLGGFDIQNTASILGNVYSNGPVNGTNSNLIKGSVVSSGPGGSVSGIHATSSVYAHTISNSTVDGNAYYQTLTNTTVKGIKYPGSADQPASTLPIPDSLVAQWENDAAGGGTINSPCPYKITNNITMGPVKINCNLEISNNPVVTLTGPVWVAGNISIKNSPTIRVASSLGGKSVAIIADNPSNRSTGSTIRFENSSSIFQGSGEAGSYVLLLSQNNSAEQGGETDAIEIGNTASGAILLYAGHGNVDIENSASLKEVTAYKVTLKNSAQVTYETGLANLLFTSGPSGAWSIKDWKEVE